MATDVLGSRSATFSGAMAAEDALITFSNLTTAGTNTNQNLPLLLQNIQLQYSQAVTRLYDLTQHSVFYVRGRAAGQASIGQIIGPTRIADSFLTKFGSVCNAGTNDLVLTMSNACSSAGGAANGSTWSYGDSITAKYAVITAMALQVQAEQMVVQQNVSLMFSALERGGQPTSPALGNINFGGLPGDALA
jgi:hypothetical protein